MMMHGENLALTHCYKYIFLSYLIMEPRRNVFYKREQRYNASFRSSYANKFKECLAIYETKTHSFKLENTFIFCQRRSSFVVNWSFKMSFNVVHYDDDACDLVLEFCALSRFIFAIIASEWKIFSRNIFRSKQITITISNKAIKFKCKKEPLSNTFWFAVTLEIN